MKAEYKECIERDLEYAEIIQSLKEGAFLALLRAGMGESLSSISRHLPRKEIWSGLEDTMRFGGPTGETWEGRFFEVFNQRVKNFMSGKEGIDKEDVYLGKCTFPIDMFLTGVRCARYVYFNESAFYKDVNFDETSFARVDFSRVEFMHYANFRKTIFGEDATFSECTFRDRVNFDDSHFKNKSYFRGLRFHNPVSFDGATFGGESDFGNAIFDLRASFVKTVFYGMASFTGCKDGWEEISLIGNFDFSGAKFFRVPWFEGTAIRQDSSLPIAEYIPASPDKIPENQQEAYWHQEENASRALALAMGNIRNRPAEGKFHALELHARRHKPSTPRHRRCMLGIYEKVSQCGQSIFRPLAYLAAFFYLFTVLFKIFFEACSSEKNSLSLLYEAFKFSFQSIVPFYAQVKGGFENTSTIPDAIPNCYLYFHVFSLLETLIATGCLAMSIIALRWHLRRG